LTFFNKKPIAALALAVAVVVMSIGHVAKAVTQKKVILKTKKAGLRFTKVYCLLTEFLIGKVLVKDRDGRVWKLVNLNPGLQTKVKTA
jgi:hypothetical protein